MTIFQERTTAKNLKIEDDLTGLSIPSIRRAIAENLLYIQDEK